MTDSNTITYPPLSIRVTQLVALILFWAGLGIAHAGDAGINSSAGRLRAQHGTLQDQLQHNQFQRPLHLDSRETPDGVNGDIHAIVTYPFAVTAAALSRTGNWCDILILHINTKYCRASTTAKENVLNVSIGKKFEQPLDEAHRVVFSWRIASQSPEYLKITMNADEGPLSTRDYRIAIEAIPLGNDQTFIHLSYSYGYGLAGRLAMQAYLGTIGRNKVGFTATGNRDGQSGYVGGMRGVVERNTMRYYLAIESYLGALSAPPPTRLEKRIQDWFAAIERYPRQLHEMERDAYLDMKRREHQRQQALLPAEMAG